MNHQHPNIKFTFEVKKTMTFHFQTLKFVQKTINLLGNLYFSGNLPLVVYLPILIVLYLYRTKMVQSICCCFDVLNFVPLMKVFIMRQFSSNNFLRVTDILIIFLIVVLKSFSINFTLSKIYQTIEKKQLLIILPFLGHLSFETSIRLNSCIINQLRSCSLRTAFQSKNPSLQPI